ncbi:MAG: isoprenyl transferase [candidate division WOR-3 bacterium]
MAIPQHIAIIMDGNGRWAKKRGLPRIVGHREGVESVRAIVKAASELGIKYLTLYTFSTENWQRPKDEVDFLMDMLKELLIKETPELHKNKVRMLFIGRTSDLRPDIQEEIKRSIELTKNNPGLVLCLALSYGGRGEIVDAVKKILNTDRRSKIDLNEVDETWFRNFLYHPEIPDPDILIRTGCEKRIRLSNFLIWQSAYTELYFTPKLWPDFRKKELQSAIEDFQKRERRFGRVE